MKKNILSINKTYGRISFEIKNEKVWERMKRLADRRIKDGREYMFVRPRSGDMYSSEQFSKLVIETVYKYIGKRIGSQMIRKIDVSEKREGEMSLKEKEEWARRMLHSPYMSERYRRL